MHSYQLSWQFNKFIAPDVAVASHFVSLQENHDKIVKLLQWCDFSLHRYRVVDDKVFINKNNLVEFEESQEGAGFCLCLHLFGYLFDENQDFQLMHESFQHCLHPLLYAALCKMLRIENNFSQLIDTRANNAY